MNNAQPNYFLVNRQLLDSDRWLSEPFTRGQAWVDLFGLAQHSDSFVRIRGIKIELKRGQLAWSQLSLAKRWKWSRNKTVRFLKELENNGDLKQQNNEVTSLITVIKYDYWQGEGSTEGSTERQQKVHQKGNRKATEGSHTIKVNNDNNENNEKNLPAGSQSERVDKDIISIIEIFHKGNNPTINYGNKTNRLSADELIKKYGVEKTKRMAEFAVSISSQKFAPVITTPYQLKEKLGELIAFHQRQSTNQISIIS